MGHQTKDQVELLKPNQLQPKLSNLKACLFNLIIYTNEPRRAAYFQDIALLITKHFPCRIIFIKADPEVKKPYLRVSTKQEADEIGLKCDFITIDVGGEYLNRVRFLILPYFVPDLPIYLLWGQDPTTETYILPHLNKFSTRLVFDPESCKNLQHFGQNLLTWLHKFPMEVTDMNWARIRGWREILGQIFDTKERIDQLQAATSVKITYNNRASDLSFYPQTQAYYLQAWLACQLGWQFESIKKKQSTLVLHYRTQTQIVEVTLEGKNRQNIASEEILEIEIADQSSFLYSLTRKIKDQVTVHCNTLDLCELPFTLFLPNIWSGRSFMQEIFYKETSQQYFNMLRLIKHIPWSRNNAKI
jgi:glucose-6-phosphate dehydrogenase assembly protein OpcA